jgi:hypothetical protein
MWRERFSRRMIDRERRKKNREVEVDRRRGPIHVEENEAKVLEDDEEVSSITCGMSIKVANHRSSED